MRYIHSCQCVLTSSIASYSYTVCGYIHWNYITVPRIAVVYLRVCKLFAGMNGRHFVYVKANVVRRHDSRCYPAISIFNCPCNFLVVSIVR